MKKRAVALTLVVVLCPLLLAGPRYGQRGELPGEGRSRIAEFLKNVRNWIADTLDDLPSPPRP